MPEQFPNDIPGESRTLSLDARAILRAIHAFESRTREREESHCAQTTEQIEQLTQTQREMQHSIEQIVAGFPDGNPDGHRRYHEAVIKRQEIRSATIRETWIHVFKLGVAGIIGWLALVIWDALRIGVQK